MTKMEDVAPRSVQVLVINDREAHQEHRGPAAGEPGLPGGRRRDLGRRAGGHGQAALRSCAAQSEAGQRERPRAPAVLLSKDDREQLAEYIKEHKFLPGGRYLIMPVGHTKHTTIAISFDVKKTHEKSGPTLSGGQ